MGTNDIAELLKLEVNERLAIAEQLWESVRAEREDQASSSAEVLFVNERLDAYLKDPSGTVGWNQVKKELGL